MPSLKVALASLDAFRRADPTARRPRGLVAFRLAILLTAWAGTMFALGADNPHLLSSPPVGRDFRAAFASASPAPTQAGTALVFSTYLGGSQFEHIRDVTTDSQGNIYVTGGTTSPDFPVTASAYQGKRNPSSPDRSRIQPFDVFVVKLDPNGRILWSTFIGGPNYDRAYAVKVDAQGYVYVAGRAGRGFPVSPGAFQTTFMGGQGAAFYGPQDGFVLKLSPDGSGLVWAGYFGTSDPAAIRDLAIDSNGDIYIASDYSDGTYPPAVQRAFNNSPHGGRDAVVAKIKSDGSQVLWATFLGGSGWDSGENSIRLDGADNPYVLLTTESPDIFTSPSAYQRTYAGEQDLYVTKLRPEDGKQVWATYLGSSKNESTETHEFAVDQQGNVYIAAPTRSTDFPTTPGAFQPTYGGGDNEAFVAKISSDGSRLLASTFVGGHGNDRPEGMAVDALGNVYFTGTTTSVDFPVTPDAFQSKLGGTRDAIAVVLSADFSHLLYSTYLGGGGEELGRAATVDSQGNFYLGGETNSSDWPTRDAVQPAYRGNGEAFVAKFRSIQPRQNSKPNRQ